MEAQRQSDNIEKNKDWEEIQFAGNLLRNFFLLVIRLLTYRVVITRGFCVKSVLCIDLTICCMYNFGIFLFKY